MDVVQAGDIVRVLDGKDEMIVIGQDYEATEHTERTWFCAWEAGTQLHQQTFPESKLAIVRKEKRRIPREGALQFPVHRAPNP